MSFAEKIFQHKDECAECERDLDVNDESVFFKHGEVCMICIENNYPDWRAD
jgi:hypothetical protein